MQHTLIFKGETSLLQNWMKSRPADFCKCSAPIKKVTHRSGKRKHLIYLLFCRICGETKSMRIVCVSEKCHLLQESEHMTKAMVRLRNVSELGSSGRSGKICMTYQLLCWEHQVRKARWRGKWIWAGKEIKLADLEYTKWIGTKNGN